jgi:hypothetical protein
MKKATENFCEIIKRLGEQVFNEIYGENNLVHLILSMKVKMKFVFFNHLNSMVKERKC